VQDLSTPAYEALILSVSQADIGKIVYLESKKKISVLIISQIYKLNL
jgi:hypothetical protein